MIEGERVDRRGRRITLREITDDWLAVADVAPRDEQRRFVPPLAARYQLMNLHGGPWTSLGIYADGVVVGHIMWARDEDGSYWLGGLIVDRTQQGCGVGRASVELLASALAERPDASVIRLSYDPANRLAARLYDSLGFVPNGEWVDRELVVERIVRV